MDCTSQELILETSDEDTFVWEYFKESVWDILNKEKEKNTNPEIFFYLRNLDVSIKMGIPLGYLAEICGMPFSGRTMVCIKLCISVTFPVYLQGHDGEALYMDSRKKFDPAMIDELVHATNVELMEPFKKMNFKLSVQEVRRRIHYVCIDGEEKFHECIDTLKDFLRAYPKIRLVIVDTLIAIFYGSTERSIQRVVNLHKILYHLADVATECNVAIVIVNDMTTKVYPNGQSSKIVPALGAYFAFKIPRIIQLSPTIDGKYAALLKRGFRNTGQNINFEFFKKNIIE